MLNLDNHVVHSAGRRLHAQPCRPVRVVAGAALCAAMLLGSGCGESSGGPSEAAILPATRGVIEGFYGPPYAFDARLDLVRFLPRAGLNTYLYAPKLDPYHRSGWRDAYPAEWMDHFAALTQTARLLGLRFVYGLSPGNDFDPGSDDQAAVDSKLGALFDVGVRDFCLLFDDLAPGSPAADPQVQVRIVTDTLAALQARDPNVRLWFISHFYAGTAAEISADRSPFDRGFVIKSSAAYAAYAALPPEVAILWTGPRVFASPLTAEDTAAFHDLVGRPLVIWDNYPVNDSILTRELFLAPYREREAGVVRVADGVLLNPMLQPEASKIALWTAGRFFAAGTAGAYDPDAALHEALVEVAGSDRGGQVLALLADQFHSHPLIGNEPESPALAERAAAFFATRSAQDEEALRALLGSFAAIADDLEREVPNTRLVNELREPARKLALFGAAGLVGLDLLDQSASATPSDSSQMQALLDEAQALPWLVGANTAIPTGIDVLLAGRPAVQADVFGDFFSRLAAELATDR
jgi:hyaluronoglucosaminidase